MFGIYVVQNELVEKGIKDQTLGLRTISFRHKLQPRQAIICISLNQDNRP